MTEEPAAWRYHAFGLRIESDFPLPGLGPATGGARALRMRLAPFEWLRESPPQPPLWETRIEGLPYRMWRADGYRLVHGDAVAFHLSADLGTLWCAPAARDATGWQRFLLDTVLWTTSLLRGFELLHASAVAGEDGVVAFAGGSGCGKTSLAAELVDRGAELVCDDALALRRGLKGIEAHPGPPLMNLQAGAGPEIGYELASFGDERWVALPPLAPGGRDIAAVCFLERRPGARLGLQPENGAFLPLLAHSIGFDRALPERRQGRFELFADLAQGSLLRLTAGMDDAPAALADLAEPLLAHDAWAACA